MTSKTLTIAQVLFLDFFSYSSNWSCKLLPITIDMVTKASQQIHKTFNYEKNLFRISIPILKFLYILLNYPTLEDQKIPSSRSLLQFQQGNNEVWSTTVFSWDMCHPLQKWDFEFHDNLPTSTPKRMHITNSSQSVHTWCYLKTITCS